MKIEKLDEQFKIELTKDEYKLLIWLLVAKHGEIAFTKVASLGSTRGFVEEFKETIRSFLRNELLDSIKKFLKDPGLIEKSIPNDSFEIEADELQNLDLEKLKELLYVILVFSIDNNVRNKNSNEEITKTVNETIDAFIDQVLVLSKMFLGGVSNEKDSKNNNRAD